MSAVQEEKREKKKILFSTLVVIKDYANPHLQLAISKLNGKQNNQKTCPENLSSQCQLQMRFWAKFQFCLVKQAVRLQLLLSIWILFKGNILNILNNYQRKRYSMY